MRLFVLTALSATLFTACDDEGCEVDATGCDGNTLVECVDGAFVEVEVCEQECRAEPSAHCHTDGMDMGDM